VIFISCSFFEDGHIHLLFKGGFSNRLDCHVCFWAKGASFKPTGFGEVPALIFVDVSRQLRLCWCCCASSSSWLSRSCGLHQFKWNLGHLWLSLGCLETPRCIIAVPGNTGLSYNPCHKQNGGAGQGSPLLWQVSYSSRHHQLPQLSNYFLQSSVWVLEYWEFPQSPALFFTNAQGGQ